MAAPRPVSCLQHQRGPSRLPPRHPSGLDGRGRGRGRTVTVGVHGAEVQPALLHGLLEVLGRLLHDPALQLLGADLPVAVHVHPAGGRARQTGLGPEGQVDRRAAGGSTGSRDLPRTATHPPAGASGHGVRKGTGASGVAGERGRCAPLPSVTPQQSLNRRKVKGPSPPGSRRAASPARVHSQALGAQTQSAPVTGQRGDARGSDSYGAREHHACARLGARACRAHTHVHLD